MNLAVLGVGSNIDARRHIAKARELLTLEQTFLKESSFVATTPIGASPQPDYLNGAFLVSTKLDRDSFERYVKHLETRLGRVRTGDAYGPRTIDLDIVVWNGRIVNDDFHERDFVRNAVKELLPGLENAGKGPAPHVPF